MNILQFATTHEWLEAFSALYRLFDFSGDSRSRIMTFVTSAEAATAKEVIQMYRCHTAFCKIDDTLVSWDEVISQKLPLDKLVLPAIL